MPIEGADYFVRVIPFPVSVPAFLRLNRDGTYSVYINSNVSTEKQQEGFWHEIDHIVNDDIYYDGDIIDIEPQLN